MPIPWYYTWSNRFFHEVLQDSMKDSAFTLSSIEDTENTLDYTKIVSLLEHSDKPYIVYSHSEIIVKSEIFKHVNAYIQAGETMVFFDEDSGPSPCFMVLKV